MGKIFNTYTHINLLAGEGRNFINKNREKYDLIQITATDTFAALSTGAYVLMDSYLYTTDAFSSYFDHLTEDGLVCIVVGDHLLTGQEVHQPLNTRLMLQYLDVLKAKGVESPQHHIAILGRKEPNANITCIPLLKKNQFSEEDIAKLSSFAEEMGFFLIYNPLDETAHDNIMRKIIPATTEERKRIIRQLPYNITPCTDNKPFFYNFIKWKTVFNLFNQRKFLFF